MLNPPSVDGPKVGTPPEMLALAAPTRSSILGDLHRVEVVLTVLMVVLPQLLAFFTQLGISHQVAAQVGGGVTALFVLSEAVKDAINRVPS